MAVPESLSWQCAFHRGKRALKHHNNELALRFLESALSRCPVSNKQELSEILFFLGSTLNKLGMRSCALKSWVTSGRLHKNGFATRFIERFSNGYGMAKQISSNVDDWKAFFSIQLYRYLCTKKSGKLGTEAERDMIEELIADGWKELNFSCKLSELEPEKKMELFRNVRIVFPVLHANSGEIGRNGSMIPVDFGKKRKIRGDDHCFCGSGLPYKSCCGRIPGKEELLSGII